MLSSLRWFNEKNSKVTIAEIIFSDDISTKNEEVIDKHKGA